MNDDEIEKLIARLPRPAPSQKLDTRIAETTRQAAPTRHSWQMRSALVLAGSTVCAGFLGFVLGRQTGATVIPTKVVAEPAAAVAALSPSQKSQDSATTDPATKDPVHIVRAENDALAKFVLPPKKFVGLFGNGRLETRDSASQLR